MKKKQIQLMVLFMLSMILLASFQTLSFAQIPSKSTSSNFFDNAFWQNVAVAVLSAVLAFLGGYALSGISRRSGSGRRLSYSSNIETGLINVEKNIKEKVTVLYENQPIANLCNIRFDIENTGNSVIKSQEIRFEFTPDTRILEFYFDPQPQPEMQVEKLTDSGLRDFERKCRIGHIEKGQEIGIRFIVTNDSEVKLTPYPYNEDGNVEFNSRATTKELGQREQVARFLSLLIMYFVIPPVFSLFSLSPFNETIAGLLTLPRIPLRFIRGFLVH
ncbi:MAG: hypothetical protein QNJ42_00515 [Crocosphaera sp.]|nr:hypothetical protein [Crocosphaera sp.]